MCVVEYFPPPDEHLFCCLKRPDCECPRRMGICAEDVEPEPPRHDDSGYYEDDLNVEYFGNGDCLTC
jgi:hypothetical protein